jgi:hypothetical protein
MNPRKCDQCSLVNFVGAEKCRRCGALLTERSSTAYESPAGPVKGRGIGRRLVWLAAVTVVLIFIWSRSLLLTSDAIAASQRQVVMRAIALLERAGFAREVMVLRHFANYRATDNWWNIYLGHPDAYAATNFPLGVVTLYPPFFTAAVDDIERAAILLHEAQHLLGAGEEAALDSVWRAKQRLGWTAAEYGETKVWKNTKEWTAAGVPALFQCGPDRQADCVR